MKFVDVKEQDNGSSVALPMDALLRVFLPENPSTGYTWQQSFSGGCLEELSHEFMAQGGLAVGAPGTAVFRFKPVGPGRCQLLLKLWRPWEGEKSVIKRFRLDVSVVSR